MSHIGTLNMNRTSLLRGGLALGAIVALGAAGREPSTSEAEGETGDDGNHDLARQAREAAGGSEPDDSGSEDGGDTVRRCSTCEAPDSEFDNFGAFGTHCRNCTG